MKEQIGILSWFAVILLFAAAPLLITLLSGVFPSFLSLVLVLFLIGVFVFLGLKY